MTGSYATRYSSVSCDSMIISAARVHVDSFAWWSHYTAAFLYCIRIFSCILWGGLLIGISSFFQALELEEQSSSDEVALQQGLANAAAAGPAAGPSAGRRVVLPPQTKLNESLAEVD